MTVAGLVINFIPDQPTAVAEMARATKPGGIVAGYVWDYAGEMQMMRRFWDAAIVLNPTAKDLDEGVRFPVCQPDALQRLFRNAGLENVTTRGIDAPTIFTDFNDFWMPFLGGAGTRQGIACRSQRIVAPPSASGLKRPCPFERMAASI